ncbi:GNAT family N-acetyltransferase [Neolewinella litorea]|uniref:GNAT family N-acetyltransferase n=1 Tax=Neolewinella litorea TaxID=2562452 RepID=A0A4S4NDV8_9BACT|nr:GNAT family N-acetyltransferase [Neolewinella litorea]THH37702.1 GNAT family N-acetyltransferase [Neolewinella litorea]
MEAPIKITLARKDYQLKQILALQRANLIESVDADTASAQGFVTATHDLPLLQRMTAAAASVIAIRERKVLGYCLAMTRDFSEDIPALTFLIQRQDSLMHRGQLLGESEYIIMGQICVAEEARGLRLPDRMYKYLRACYHLRYTYCVTAIDARNTRSQHVHERVGFEELDRFTSADGRNWILVIWNWRDGMEGFGED